VRGELWLEPCERFLFARITQQMRGNVNGPPPDGLAAPLGLAETLKPKKNPSSSRLIAGRMIVKPSLGNSWPYFGLQCNNFQYLYCIMFPTLA
jgi:hypothetical protein